MAIKLLGMVGQPGDDCIIRMYDHPGFGDVRHGLVIGTITTRGAPGSADVIKFSSPLPEMAALRKKWSRPPEPQPASAGPPSPPKRRSSGKKPPAKAGTKPARTAAPRRSTCGDFGDDLPPAAA